MILCIETATNVCSVALADKGKLIGLKESAIDKSHASLLTVFTEELMQENNIKVSDLDAVAVSKGPGSYTGLRIGVSAAKGLCYGADIPLISVNTLESMFHTFLLLNNDFRDEPDLLFCPMIDARRMEVYSSLFNAEGLELQEVKAEIIDGDSYRSLLDKQKIVFFGNGADKCTDVISHENAIFSTGFQLSATGLAMPGDNALAESRFEDTAYFEPFYLKDFIATIPKKNLLK